MSGRSSMKMINQLSGWLFLSWKYFRKQHFYGNFLKIIYLLKHRRKGEGEHNFNMLDQKKKVQSRPCEFSLLIIESDINVAT